MREGWKKKKRGRWNKFPAFCKSWPDCHCSNIQVTLIRTLCVNEYSRKAESEITVSIKSKLENEFNNWYTFSSY